MSVYGNWKRLNYHKPEIGQKCEWIVFGFSWKDEGIGKWYDNDNNPDDNPLGCTIRGFYDEKGLLVSDPKRTIWRHMNNNYTLSWWEQKQEVIKKPWWKFWDKELIKSYWLRRSFEVTPEIGDFIIKNQDKIQELLCTFFPKIWGLQLENISSSTAYISTSGHTLIEEEGKTNFIKNTNIPNE